MASSIQDIITLVGIGLVGKVSSFLKSTFRGLKILCLGLFPLFLFKYYELNSSARQSYF